MPKPGQITTILNAKSLGKGTSHHSDISQMFIKPLPFGRRFFFAIAAATSSSRDWNQLILSRIPMGLVPPTSVDRERIARNSRGNFLVSRFSVCWRAVLSGR